MSWDCWSSSQRPCYDNQSELAERFFFVVVNPDLMVATFHFNIPLETLCGLGFLLLVHRSVSYCWVESQLSQVFSYLKVDQEKTRETDRWFHFLSSHSTIFSVCMLWQRQSQRGWNQSESQLSRKGKTDSRQDFRSGSLWSSNPTFWN